MFAKTKEDKPKWEVSVLDVPSARLIDTTEVASMLNDGWEPFSHVVFQDNSEHLYFKRLKPESK